MKIVGAILILSSCTAIGILLAAKLLRREKSLRTIISFLEALTLELKYNMSPLDEMFEQLSLQPRFSVLIFPGLCFDMLKNGAAFPRAFKEAVESVAPRLGLKDADAEALASCAEILGSTEAEGQLFALEGRRERLKELLSDAHEKALSFGKMYRALGFLAGVGAVVLIL